MNDSPCDKCTAKNKAHCKYQKCVRFLTWFHGEIESIRSAFEPKTKEVWRIE